MTEKLYTEDDLRDAFREGWKERNRNPGLRATYPKLGHALFGRHGGAPVYVKDTKMYHASFWLNSAYRKGLAP